MNAAAWDLVLQIFQIAGGLGLFLYGMKMMSDGLENLAGNKLSMILEKATSNRFLGVTIGVAITCVVQSSTAATVMTVGFVNSSLMTLAQSIGVIIGINIGTSITTQIVSFNIGQIAPLFIFIGALLHILLKKRKVRNLGFVLLGFGVLLFGFSVMSAPLKVFAMKEGFQSILTAFSSPFLALLAGVVFTIIIQSSTASIGIIIALFLGGINMPFQAAAFLVLGCNIGTCLTTILVTIPANRESKRAGLVHLLFSVIGCLVFGPVIALVPGSLTWIQTLWPDGARQVAMFHTFFNIATAALLIGLVKPLTALVQKIIPEKPSENTTRKRLKYLNAGLLNKPDQAIEQVRLEAHRLGRMVRDNLRRTLNAFQAQDFDEAQTALENEKTINFIYSEITAWLARIRSQDVSGSFLAKTEMLLHAISHMERIGDHARNIAEYTILEEKYGLIMSAAAMEELLALSEKINEINAAALEIFEQRDKSRLPEVETMKAGAICQANECMKNHMQRLKDKSCDPRGAMVFTDIVIDLRHCASHANNVAQSILGSRAWDEQPELEPA